VLLYYITDRRAFPGTEAEKRTRLIAKIAEATRCGVNFIQLREKDLNPRELERLARDAVQVIRDYTPLDSLASPGSLAPRLLINSRIDIAVAVGADGVHLTSNDIAASDARAIWTRAAQNSKTETRNPLFAASCHTIEEVRLAESHGADFAVFAPVFEKSVLTGPVTTTPGMASHEVTGREQRQLISKRSREDGLAALRSACQSVAFPNNVEGVGTSSMPVLALGGITLENAPSCLTAGAAGIAAIRLFQENDISEIVRRLG
jgi:thiamine-phosphate pyrophosphorylase